MKGNVLGIGAQSPPVNMAMQLFSLSASPDAVQSGQSGQGSFAQMLASRMDQYGSEQNKQVVGSQQDESLHTPDTQRAKDDSPSDAVSKNKEAEDEKETTQKPLEPSRPEDSTTAMEAAASTQNSNTVKQDTPKESDSKDVKPVGTGSGKTDSAAVSDAVKVVMEAKTVQAALAQAVAKGALKVQENETAKTPQKPENSEGSKALVNPQAADVKVKASVNPQAADVKVKVSLNPQTTDAKTSDNPQAADAKGTELSGQQADETIKKPQVTQTKFSELVGKQVEKQAKQQFSVQSVTPESDKANSDVKVQTGVTPEKLANISVLKTPAVKENQESQVKVQDVKGPTTTKPVVEVAVQPNVGGVKTETVTQLRETFGSARLAETRDLNPTAQIIRNVGVLVKDGQTSMKMQLYPENMGKIDLQLVNTPNGVAVTITPEQATTSNLLQSQLEDLRQAFTQAGIQLSDLHIGQNKSQEQQPKYQGQGSQIQFQDIGNSSEEGDGQYSQVDYITSALDYRI